MNHTIKIEEGERQAILLALAHLALERPGWNDLLKNIALKMDNATDGIPEMFQKFKEYAPTITTVEGLGKYDAQCQQAMEACRAAVCMLIVMEGKHGNGFSVKCPGPVIPRIPNILRRAADLIETERMQTKGN